MHPVKFSFETNSAGVASTSKAEKQGSSSHDSYLKLKTNFQKFQKNETAAGCVRIRHLQVVFDGGNFPPVELNSASRLPIIDIDHDHSKSECSRSCAVFQLSHR